MKHSVIRKVMCYLLIAALMITMLPLVSETGRVQASTTVNVTALSGKKVTGEDIDLEGAREITPGGEGVYLNGLDGRKGYVRIYYDPSQPIKWGSLRYKILKYDNRVETQVSVKEDTDKGVIRFYVDGTSGATYRLSVSYLSDASVPEYAYTDSISFRTIFVPSEISSSYAYTYQETQDLYVHNAQRSVITLNSESELTFTGWQYDYESYTVNGSQAACLHRADSLALAITDTSGKEQCREILTSGNAYTKTITLPAGVYYLTVARAKASSWEKSGGIYSIKQVVTPVATPTPEPTAAASAAPIPTDAPQPTLPADPSKVLMVSVCTTYQSPEPGTHEIKLGAEAGESAVLPVFIPKPGYVALHFENTVSDPISLQLYTEEDCKTAFGSAMKYEGTSLDPEELEVTKAGTYYLKATYPSGTSAENTLLATGYEIPSDHGDLQASEQIWKNPSADPSGYHAFIIKKTSYVRLQGREYVGDLTQALKIRVLDAGYTDLIGGTLQEKNLYTAGYCLSPGTYYVASSGTAIYGLSATVKSWPNKAGAKKKKARLIRKGKTVSGNFTLQQARGKTGWYRVALTKKQRLNLEVSNYSDRGYLQVTVMAAKKKQHFKKSVSKVKAGRIATIKSTKKLARGTYYIKVAKVKKNYDSAYLIKYRKK